MSNLDTIFTAKININGEIKTIDLPPKDKIGLIIYRCFSYAIDFSLIYLIGLAVTFLLGFIWLRLANWVVDIALIIAPVYVVICVKSCGGTIGMLIFGLEMRRISDWKRPGILALFFRHFVSALSYVLSIGFIWSFADSAGRTLHDKLSGTIVIDRQHPACQTLNTKPQDQRFIEGRKCYIRYVVGLVSIAISLYILMFWLLLMRNELVPLGNKYYYLFGEDGVTVRLLLDYNSADIARLNKINDNNRMEPRIGPDVDGYHVYKRFIVGHVAESDIWRKYIALSKEGREAKAKEAPGYFIIDKKNDTVCNGLSKQDLLKKLHNIGINHEPKLYKPCKLDELLRRNKPS